MKLVVVCPANAVTGGPEAMHQLVHIANHVERGSAAILYWPFAPHTTPQPYQHYVCPKILRDQVPEDALVVFPEIWPEMAHTFKNRCALWWLSVGNFGTHGQRNLDKISLHLCQSEYAWDHVRDKGKRMMLTDWVSVQPVLRERQPQVVVNPAKDAGLLRPFVQSGRFQVAELGGMDSQGVSEVLHASKVYVDFGKHPGRDRLPREAALAGCLVMSTYIGSATYWEDMPLSNWYKFETLDEVIGKVAELMDRESPSASQLVYQGWVAKNRSVFVKEVESLLSVVE
jgi:hypothetical protein